MPPPAMRLASFAGERGTQAHVEVKPPAREAASWPLVGSWCALAPLSHAPSEPGPVRSGCQGAAGTTTIMVESSMLLYRDSAMRTTPTQGRPQSERASPSELHDHGTVLLLLKLLTVEMRQMRQVRQMRQMREMREREREKGKDLIAD